MLLVRACVYGTYRIHKVLRTFVKLLGSLPQEFWEILGNPEIRLPEISGPGFPISGRLSKISGCGFPRSLAGFIMARSRGPTSQDLWSASQGTSQESGNGFPKSFQRVWERLPKELPKGLGTASQGSGNGCPKSFPRVWERLPKGLPKTLGMASQESGNGFPTGFPNILSEI